MPERKLKMGDWTTNELAAAAGVSAAYIRQLLLSDKLEGHKHGRDWRIPSTVAQRWLENRKENS